jgi:uncharacterized phage protein (TIGR01671 family)
MSEITMREIKFRARDKDERVMLEDKDLFFQLTSRVSDEESKLLIAKWNIRKEFFSGLQRKYEVMQFTGLQDKDGNEIWEGDVINVAVTDYMYSRNGVFEVVFGAPVFHLKNVDYDCTGFPTKGLSVIGNVYENPELLNGGVR